MAGRKDKNVVDYFPHYVNSGKTMYVIESKYGLEGYGAWFKLLEALGRSDNHYIDCRDDIDWEYLQAEIKFTKAGLGEFLDLLAKLGAIHKELWENRIIWSGNFIKNVEDAYKRRNNKCMHFYDLCKHLLIKCKHKYDDYGIYVGKNTQSKVEDNKEDIYIYPPKDFFEKSSEEVKKLITTPPMRRAMKFYGEQIENIDDDELKNGYKKFVRILFGENNIERPLEDVLKIKSQLTPNEFEKLLALKSEKIEEGKAVSFQETLEKMENTEKYTKDKKSLYLTLRNWFTGKFV